MQTTTTLSVKICWVVIMMIGLLLVQSISAQPFYVDPCAQVNGNGSQAAPFNTLASAVAAAKTFSGSKIIMKGGFYPEPMTISNAVTLTAYNGSAVVGTNKFGVGWRDVILNLSSGESTNARVYYPSLATGPNTQIASPCVGAFPALVYAHGMRQLGQADLCSWSDDDLRTENTKDYLQAEGLLKRLASSGFIAISFNWHGLTSHYHDASKNHIAQFIIDAITHLGNEFGGSVDLQNVGLIGHSTGGAAVIKAAEMLRGSRNPPGRINGVGLIAPIYPFMQSNLNPIGPVLVLNGTREHPCQVGLSPLEIYCEATSPKHLVYVAGANHFGYTDGICLDPDQVRIGECAGGADSYGIDSREMLPYAPGWDNSSQVGGATGQQAQARQQLAATNYLQAFFSYYLQGNAEALDYLIQQNSRKEQCGHPSLNQDCAVDFLDNTPVDPPSNLEFVPVRYFADLQSLNVQVKVSSCAQ